MKIESVLENILMYYNTVVLFYNALFIFYLYILSAIDLMVKLSVDLHTPGRSCVT